MAHGSNGNKKDFRSFIKEIKEIHFSFCSSTPVKFMNCFFEHKKADWRVLQHWGFVVVSWPQLNLQSNDLFLQLNDFKQSLPYGDLSLKGEQLCQNCSFGLLLSQLLSHSLLDLRKQIMEHFYLNISIVPNSDDLTGWLQAGCGNKFKWKNMFTVKNNYLLM